MPVPINKAVYFRRYLFETVNEKTSGPAQFVGVHGVVFYCKATAAGILHIDIKVGDTWEELTEETVRANKLHVIDVGFYIPEARIRFQPKSADTYFSASAYGYPSVYVREDLSMRDTEKDQF